MANQVKMAIQEAITNYSRLGWSRRRMARALGINRETVARYLRLAGSKPAVPPSGLECANPAIVPAGAGDPKPAIVPAGHSGRVSQCAPFQESIEKALEKGLSAQRIYQDLVVDSAFQGHYDAVKRYVRRLRQEAPERFFRLECEPGEEAQVDFGRGAPIRTPEGRLQKTWFLRVVLSYSRKAYSEVVLRQTTDSFIRALENAFRYFGGVPTTVIIDNLRAAVKKPDWYEPELNPKVREFGRHYATVILPTRPYTPQHKGKVENSVGYVKGNALKGRVFDSLAGENLYLLNWEDRVADQRIHGTTRQQVLARFQQEKPSLQPLPASIFPCFQEGRRRVHRDSFVEVEKAYYEVPEEYVQREVWVRWDGRTVRVFNDRLEQLKVHARVEKGRFSYSREATSRGRVCGVERSASWLVQKAITIGPQCGAWADASLAQRGVEAIRPLYGFLALARSYTATRMEQACSVALADSRFYLKDIKTLLEAPQVEQEMMPFMETHPLIRDIAEYGQFLRDLYPEDEIINTQRQEDTKV
jgi:transposase